MATWNGLVHPAAGLFPMMTGDEFNSLVESIKTQGLREAAWLTVDGYLLDGRNRVAACEKAGVQPTFRTYQGDDPVSFVLALNLERRHLNQGQKAIVATAAEELYESQGLAAKSAGGTEAGRGRPREKDEEPVPQPISRNPQSRDKAGAALGVSGRAVGQAKRIKAKAPELAEQVMNGSMTLKEADAQVRQREAKARAEAERKAELDGLIAKLEGGQTVVMNMRDDLSRAIEARGLLVRIDRGTPWGNPFIMDDDGDRETVIHSYADHYLPHKPSLLSKLEELRGKAVGCWCAPEPCHGDVLAAMAQE